VAAEGTQAGGRPEEPARALEVDAVLFDLDGTLADTAPDLGAALNRVRRDRGLDPVPLETLRSSSSHGARGLLRTGMGVLPEHSDYVALRDAFLAQYESALCVDTRVNRARSAVVICSCSALTTCALTWSSIVNKFC